MPPVDFETTISAGERPHTSDLDRAATGTGNNDRKLTLFLNKYNVKCLMALVNHNSAIRRSVLKYAYNIKYMYINPLNPELNPICYLLALLGAYHFFHVSRIRVKLLTFRLLMSYIHGAPIVDVSTSHTTTQHSR